MALERPPEGQQSCSQAKRHPLRSPAPSYARSVAAPKAEPPWRLNGPRRESQRSWVRALALPNWSTRAEQSELNLTQEIMQRRRRGLRARRNAPRRDNTDAPRRDSNHAARRSDTRCAVKLPVTQDLLQRRRRGPPCPAERPPEGQHRRPPEGQQSCSQAKRHPLSSPSSPVTQDLLQRRRRSLRGA